MNFTRWSIYKLTSLANRISKQRQVRSGLRDLKLWGLEINESGHVAVDGLDAIDLIRRFGSPLFVVNIKKLKEDATNIVTALRTQASADSKVFYSYKTNCIPGILKELHAMGIGAEVISPYELWLAETLGVPGERIIYNGVNKTEESIERAARINVFAINIDHVEEIDRIYSVARRLNKKIRLGIRLGFILNSQFGMGVDTEEALAACQKIISLSDYLDLVCIHFNVTSNARSASLHKKCALRAIEFMADVKIKTGLSIKYLDIGGGFGVPTSKNMSSTEYGLYRMAGILPKPPDPRDFQTIDRMLEEIISTIRTHCNMRNIEMPNILIEPGRFITSRAEFLLATVLTVKKKENGIYFAITDAGRLSVTFPTDFEYHEVFVANRPTAPLTTSYQIMGRICTSADWMFKNRLLPELILGDFLAVMDAGAYFSSYSTNFSFPRPTIVRVDGGRAEVIRNGETFDYLISMDRI